MHRPSLYIVNINDSIEESRYPQLIPLVSRNRQNKIKSYLFDTDKKLSLYSEILLRVIIVKTFHIDNASVFFDKNAYGKPYLKNNKNFHFNISHTKGLIVIAISNSPIGVDVELTRRFDLHIAKRFFTEYEIEYINGDTEKMYQRFFEIWTKKEAYIKHNGKGLTIPLNSFNVLSDNISHKIKSFFYEDYILSVCSENKDQAYDILNVTESEIEQLAIRYLSKTID